MRKKHSCNVWLSKRRPPLESQSSNEAHSSSDRQLSKEKLKSRQFKTRLIAALIINQTRRRMSKTRPTMFHLLQWQINCFFLLDFVISISFVSNQQSRFYPAFLSDLITSFNSQLRLTKWFWINYQ